VVNAIDPGFSIRPYLASDRDAVLLVFASNTPRFFAVSESEEFAAYLDASPADALVAVAVDDGIIGFGASYRRSAEEGGLAWGMVHAAWHSRGVGGALLRRRVAHLWSAGVERISVRTSQHSAGFFRQAGFDVAGVQPDGFAPGIDEVTMVLERPRGDD
jgi:GNAT superfamily N-acetyltransferase